MYNTIMTTYINEHRMVDLFTSINCTSTIIFESHVNYKSFKEKDSKTNEKKIRPIQTTTTQADESDS